MEKNKKVHKIASLIMGSIFALGTCLSCIFGSVNSVSGRADGVTNNPFAINYSYYNFFQGWQFIVHKQNANEYLFTDNMPACIANTSGINSANTLYYDTKDENGQLQSVAFITELTGTLENNRVTVRVGAYTDHVTLLQLQPSIIDKEEMDISLRLTYFKSSKPAIYTFSFRFRDNIGKIRDIVISLDTELENGFYALKQSSMVSKFTEFIYSDNTLWEDVNGRTLANLEQANVYIQPKESYLGSFIYTYYFEGRNDLAGITVNQHIAHTIGFKHYESIKLNGVLDFVNVFFSTEIFEGFTFGTLLFIAVGGLLVGMLLKIFLGG